MSVRLNLDIKGYYEWLPVPKDVKVTDADFKALRAKVMVNGEINMRVPMKVGNVAPDQRHHDTGVTEWEICDNIACLASLGKESSRAEWLWAHFKAGFQHHLHRSHIVKINVHEDGPDAKMFKEALARYKVLDDIADEAMALYMEKTDLEDYLNRVFHTDYAKGIVK